jgi:hypothetical protein
VRDIHRHWLKKFLMIFLKHPKLIFYSAGKSGGHPLHAPRAQDVHDVERNKSVGMTRARKTWCNHFLVIKKKTHNKPYYHAYIAYTIF